MADLGAGGQVSEQWRELLMEGHRPVRVAHRMFRHVPGPPRCKMCHNPFVGRPRLPSHELRAVPQEPQPLRAVLRHAPGRGRERRHRRRLRRRARLDEYGRTHGRREFAALLNRCYVVATNVLVRHDAIIDKLIGDEVMALFIPGNAGPRYRQRAVDAADDLLNAGGQDEALVGLESVLPCTRERRTSATSEARESSTSPRSVIL
jgi:adenylate cyclase